MITLCTKHATHNVAIYLINLDGQTDLRIKESTIIEEHKILILKCLRNFPYLKVLHEKYR